MNDVEEELARGEFGLALPKLREACRRKYASAELLPGKRFPSFDFHKLPATASSEGEEDWFALAMWETLDNPRLAEDVLLLERAVLLLHSDLRFSTLAAWLALRTRPGLPRAEMDEGKKLVEMYLAPCLKAYEADGVDAAGDMYVRLVEILVTSEALGVDEALAFLKASKATKLDLVGLLEDRVKLRIKKSAVVVAAPAVAVGGEEATVPQMVEEFQRLHPNAPVAQQQQQQQQQPQPQQQPPQPLLLDKQQALLMAGGFSSLLLLFVLLRFRQKITSSVLSLGDLVFGQ